MEAYEKLGSFYLGRRWDPQGGERRDEPLLYDSRDLTTHAVCVGMTGSGKTGLCIGLLEEAALDGVPALVIDPKGDLANLLLTFPELSAESFRPWIDEGEARRQGLTPDEFAAAQAELWRNGLADWSQGPERIRRLRETAEMAVYTPGSESGRPLSIVSSFAAPPPELAGDVDLLRERVSTTVAGLLGLLGVDADPIRSREHILLSTLLDHAWRAGHGLDLPGLIRAIQSPPVDRVGVLELDTFYPADERFELAMQLNNLLAAPGFRGWMSGEPLDVGRLLYDERGRPRLAICSIAHLSDAERMFFVSLLLTETIAWMRTRPGTSSLRALVYMDEIFGYMPPVAEPPSKRPLLTLLKQARAFGLGVVLATQNPVDLDYKGLSNTGTWLIGRLQTERDRKRLLDGLAGAGNAALDRGEIEKLLGGLGKRVFLLHNVHDEAPTLFRTRWAMSYLRGPLTREQIRSLCQAPGAAVGGPPRAAGAAPTESVAATARAAAAGPPPAVAGAGRPLLDPEIPQVFVPPGGPPAAGSHWRGNVLGVGRVQFVDRDKQVVRREGVALLAPMPAADGDPDWSVAAELALDPGTLPTEPPVPLPFASLAGAGGDPRDYRRWEKQLSDALYRQRRCELLGCPELGVVGAPGEGEREVRVRLAEAAREERDRRADELRKKYAGKIDRLEERVRKARQALEREEEQARAKKLDAAISLGATLLSAFMGRSATRRATTTARGVGRAIEQSRDIARAEEDVEARLEELEALNAELEAELEELEERLDPQEVELERVVLSPRRADVEVLGVKLAWATAPPSSSAPPW